MFQTLKKVQQRSLPTLKPPVFVLVKLNQALEGDGSTVELGIIIRIYRK